MQLTRSAGAFDAYECNNLETCVMNARAKVVIRSIACASGPMSWRLVPLLLRKHMDGTKCLKRNHIPFERTVYIHRGTSPPKVPVPLPYTGWPEGCLGHGRLARGWREAGATRAGPSSVDAAGAVTSRTYQAQLQGHPVEAQVGATRTPPDL